MALSTTTLRIAMLACAASVLQISHSTGAEPVRIVFQNGTSIPATSVVVQGDKLVVTVSSDGFTQGQNFPLASADHVYGEQPPEIDQAVALLLFDKPKDALKLLEPVLAAHRGTAKFPGNFWLEAARAALVAHAVTGNAAKVTEIGREISDATPAQGIDPFVTLGKALLMSPTGKSDDKIVALKDLTVGNQPADVSAYASFYIGNIHADEKRNAEALEAYLSVPCLYPSGGIILNAAAESKAASFLITLGRREEALALVNSALRTSGGTLVAEEAKKRLESLK